MKKFILIAIFVSGLYACISDFECGFGNKCVKAPYSATGQCMGSVNQYGTKQYTPPSPDSVGVQTKGSCEFDMNCPVGFRCDNKYKVCVKR